MMQLDRRAFLGLGTLATAGVSGRWMEHPSWAQDVRGLPLTKDVATAAGRVRGVVRYRRQSVLGRAVRRLHGRREPVHAAGASHARGPARATASRSAIGLRRIPTDRSLKSSRSIGRSRWAKTV